MSEHLTDAEREVWADTWRRRASQLEQQAELYRACGDSEYAEELEAAALDNRVAADRLELGVTA